MAVDTKVKDLFNQISPSYDRFNRLSSLGRDDFWRDKALTPVEPGMRVLDVGTGTGDLAIKCIEKMAGEGTVIGLDFSKDMLKLAHQKQSELNTKGDLRWVQKGAEEIPFESDLYDGVISGFVLRNLRLNIDSILKGIHQSLKPGGFISFVDLTEPKNAFLRFFSRIYMKTVITILGKVCFKNASPVSYLGNSMQKFYRASEFSQLLKEVGFSEVSYKSYLFGAVTHYTGKK